MRKAITPFIFCFAVWLAVTWSADAASLTVGLILSGLIAAVVRNLELKEAPLLLVPDRLLWALAYVPVLFIYVVQANLDVAYRVLHPALPIRPGIVKARTSLKSAAGRVLLANSITLTPGTLTVDLVNDILYIHRIDVPKEDPDERTRRSLARFERFIKRIFE